MSTKLFPQRRYLDDVFSQRRIVRNQRGKRMVFWQTFRHITFGRNDPDRAEVGLLSRLSAKPVEELFAEKEERKRGRPIIVWSLALWREARATIRT